MATKPAKPLTTWQKWKAQPDATERLCSRIVNGETLTAIAGSLECDRSSIAEWIASDVRRSARVREARIAAAGAHDDEALAVIRAAADPFTLARAREEASHLRWRASKANPRDYGDRTVLAGDPNAPLIVTQAQRDAAVKAAAGSE